MFQDCPHCYTRILPMPGDICPSCLRDINDIQDSNPDLVAVTLLPRQPLPSCCSGCGKKLPGTRKILLEPKDQINKNTQNSPPEEDQIYKMEFNLPFCDECKKGPPPEPLKLCYDDNKAKFIVHRTFRDALKKMPKE